MAGELERREVLTLMLEVIEGLDIEWYHDDGRYMPSKIDACMHGRLATLHNKRFTIHAAAVVKSC